MVQYFMKTQTCKFGVKCKFNHPKDTLTAVVSANGLRICKIDDPFLCNDVYLTLVSGFLGECWHICFAWETFWTPMCSMIVVFSSWWKSIYLFICILWAGDPHSLCYSKQFYLKTGKCKFSSSCKFNHPKNIQIPSAGQENGAVGHMEAAVKIAGTTGDAKPFVPFTPAFLFNSKELPIRLVMYLSQLINWWIFPFTFLSALM